MVMWPFLCMYLLLWFDCVFLDLTLWTCYVLVMFFCSGLCSNYDMHSLLLIHKSERINMAFCLILRTIRRTGEGSSGDLGEPARVEGGAGTCWRWRSRHGVVQDRGEAGVWQRTQWRIGTLRVERWLGRQGVSQLLSVDGNNGRSFAGGWGRHLAQALIILGCPYLL